MLSKIDYISDGTTKTYQIPFKYNDKSKIKVLVNSEEVEFSFINNNLINIKNTPELNNTIRIVRIEDISSIELFDNDEIFDENKINRINKKFLNFIQESSEREITSLETEKDGDFLRNLDMNFNKIKNISYPVNENDIVNLEKINDMKPFEKQIGFNIGDTILSSRNDQLDEKIDDINVWIDRSFNQQLLKTDYPELSNIYPETPGGIDDLLNYNMGQVDNSTTLQSNSLREIIYDKDLNDGSFYTCILKNGDSYLIKILNDGSVIDNNIKISDSGVFVNITPTLTSNIDNSIIVSGCYYSNVFSLRYSLDKGLTFNDCVINYNGNGNNLLYLNTGYYLKNANKFIFTAKSSLDINIILYLVSDDGINFNVYKISDLFTDSINIKYSDFYNYNKNFPLIFEENNKIYWYNYIVSKNYNFAMYEISNDFLTSNKIIETSKQSKDYLNYRSNGKGCGIISGNIYTTHDFGQTIKQYSYTFEPDNYSWMVFYNKDNENFYGYTFKGTTFKFFKVNSNLIDGVNSVYNSLETIYTTTIPSFNLKIYKYSSFLNPEVLNYYENITYFNGRSFIKLTFEIKSNITFDINLIEAPSEGLTTQHKYYTKGK